MFLKFVFQDDGLINVGAVAGGDRNLPSPLTRLVTYTTACCYRTRDVISHPHFAYSICHLRWAAMKNKVSSLNGPLM